MGQSHGKKLNKASDVELTEFELNFLLKSTHFNRNEILMWHEGFLVRYRLESVCLVNNCRFNVWFILRKTARRAESTRNSLSKFTSNFIQKEKLKNFVGNEHCLIYLREAFWFCLCKSFLFKSFDTDGSGEIDFVEFMTAVSVTAKGDVKEKLTLAFKMFDLDKNGTVDRKEMEKIMEAIYDLLGEENRKGENSPSEVSWN